MWVIWRVEQHDEALSGKWVCHAAREFAAVFAATDSVSPPLRAQAIGGAAGSLWGKPANSRRTARPPTSASTPTRGVGTDTQAETGMTAGSESRISMPRRIMATARFGPVSLSVRGQKVRDGSGLKHANTVRYAGHLAGLAGDARGFQHEQCAGPHSHAPGDRERPGGASWGAVSG